MNMKVETFGVLGAGIMGRGIAEVAALKGGFERVLLYDAAAAQVAAAVDAIRQSFHGLAEKGRLTTDEKERALARLQAAHDPADLAGCQFVIEAVTEDFAVKQAVLSGLSGLLAADARIATNTSSIPITRLAAQTKQPANFIGLHFMNPANRMKGVELIRGLRTSDDTCELALALARRFEKEATVCKDRAGFVVNRVLIPMLNDAAHAVEEGGGSIESVDAWFTRAASGPHHRMGPLMLADLIGLDTVCRILAVLAGELGAAYKACGLLERLVAAGACGQKTGRGFYVWERGRPGGVNTEAAGAAGDAAAAARRAWLLMANEAVKVLEEGVSGAGDIDRAAIHCLNHPLGILAALDAYGLDAACAELGALFERGGDAYRPAGLLRRLVEAGCTGKSTAGVYSPAASGSVNPALEAFLR